MLVFLGLSLIIFLIVIFQLLPASLAFSILTRFFGASGARLAYLGRRRRLRDINQWVVASAGRT